MLRKILEEWKRRKEVGNKVTKEYTLGSQGPTHSISQATIWSDEIIQNGIANRKFAQLLIQDDRLTREAGNSIVVGVVNGSLELRTTAPQNTGTTAQVREITRMDEVITPKTITFTNNDWYAAQISIRFQDVSESNFDLFKQAKFFLQEQITQIPDVLAATALQHPDITQRVYGGDATSPATLTTGDVITPDLFSDAMEKIESSNYVPYAVLLSPTQCNALRKNPQFTDASEYGSNEVVLKGEIGNFLGVKVISSTNCPSYAAGAQDVNISGSSGVFAVAANVGIMIGRNRAGQNCAGAIFTKEKFSIEYQRNPEQMLHNFFLTGAIKASYIQKNAICLIKTSKV